MFGRKKETRAESYPLRLDDGSFAEWMGWGGNHAGVSVTETSSLGLTAVYRSVSIIAGTIAGLPLKSYRNLKDGSRERVDTWVDNPGAVYGMTAFEFKELMLVHLLLHGNFYGLHILNGAGAIVGLQPIHPSAVTVKPVQSDADRAQFGEYTKYFTVSVKDGGATGQRDFSPAELLHIPGMSTDGLKGLSPISAASQALGTGLAGDEAAARLFGNGMMLGGLVTSGEDVDPDEAKIIKADLQSRLQGVKNAGDIAFINRQLTFTPWSMPANDAQFIESRAFQIEEVARIFGIPKVLLAQDGASTWGSGIAELNRGLAKYTLMSYTSRIEESFSRLLPKPQFSEFDYTGLLQGTAREEIELLLMQVEKGLITNNEARAVRNLEPVPDTQDSGASLVDQVNAATALIRAGFSPVAALETVGLPPTEHLGLLPVTLQKAEQFETDAAVAEAELEGGLDEQAI